MNTFRYDPTVVQPMRDELTQIGFEELLTPEAVDEALSTADGTMLVVVNSVCGCAAGAARPGVRLALEHSTLPDRLVTVFAGMEIEAVDRARSHFTGYRPSSPQIALFKDGQLTHMLERHNIEGQSAGAIAADLQAAFDQYCTASPVAIAGQPDPQITREQIDERTLRITVPGARWPRQWLTKAENAGGSPLASALLCMTGVVEVMQHGETITVITDGETTWEALEEELQYALQVALEPMPPEPSINAELDDDALFRRVEELFRTDINPAIAQHGGKVDLIDVTEGMVVLRMQGGCQGCGMASVTLRQGIERSLRQMLPQIVGIQDVTDHASGSNPYFARSAPG